MRRAATRHGLEEAAYAALPAGPLSGKGLTLWRSRSGTVLHGARDCPSLARSNPTAVPHPLGGAETLGQLAWPDGLHCAPDPEDASLGDYLRHAEQAAELIAAATAALEAVPVEPEAAQEWEPGDPFERTTWPWRTIAAPFLRSLILRMTGVDLSVDVSHPRRGGLRPAELTAAVDAVDQQVLVAARSVHELMTRQVGHLARWVAGDAARTARRAIAAEVVLDQYHARNPGPLWSAYVEAGAAAANSVLLRHRSGADRRHGRLRLAPAGEVDVLRPLDIALYSHGQESLTYHRAHDRVHEPDRTWQYTFDSWLKGTHFGFGPEMYSRFTVDQPGIREVVAESLAAAESAWGGFLSGWATDRNSTCLVAIHVETTYLAMHWKAATLLLASGIVASRDTDGSVWLVAACADVEVGELIALGRQESVWVRLGQEVDRRRPACDRRTVEAVAAAHDIDDRREQLRKIGLRLPPLPTPDQLTPW